MTAPTYVHLYTNKIGLFDAIDFDTREDAFEYLTRESGGYLCTVLVEDGKVVSGTEHYLDDAQDQAYRASMARDKSPFREALNRRAERLS